MQNSLSLSVTTSETLVSTKELAKICGVDVNTVHRTVKRLGFSDVLRENTGGRPTKVFNEEQVTAIKQELQKTSKTMTTKEVAQALNVSVDTVSRAANKVLDPSAVLRRVINGGKSAVYNEEQVTAIKQEIQKHHNLASRQIDSASTELEVMQNYKQATEAMIAMLSAKTEALQAENAYLANFKTDIEKKIANAELVETPSENARNHLWQNIQKVGTAIGDYRQAWHLFWDMVKRDTSIDVKTRATNKGVKPMDYICNELNIEIFNKIFALSEKLKNDYCKE